MSSRKRRQEQEELNRIECEPISDDELDEEKGDEVQFQHGEVSLFLKTATSFYTFGKCDYDEELIGSKHHWHQVSVSCRC